MVEPIRIVWRDSLEPTLGRIGLIVEVTEYGIPLIRVHGRDFLYIKRSVTLLPRERLLFLLRTHFETYMPSDGQDELVKAVRNGEVDNVYAIIRQAYQDFNEFTSASLGVDCNFNFFVIDANGDRRTFTRDDVRKQITGHGKSDDDIPYNFAPGDQVMIRKSGMTKGKVGTVMVACKDSLIIRVCGSSYSYSREDVTLMNRACATRSRSGDALVDLETLCDLLRTGQLLNTLRRQDFSYASQRAIRHIFT
ncbi:hypothetical protein DPMN_077354 [Dreissena polymorpha]|uniref:Uncharacterized protein n=1 Tax=Dreissena polymorpha TaxID=45954 RepID=A0A9D3YP47_DREPO|nr:hypothetical protein DPMN_077354 [Dreissena polymorpha]